MNYTLNVSKYYNKEGRKVVTRWQQRQQMATINKTRFIKACKKTGGLRASVATNLGVERSSVTRYLQRNPDMQVYLDEEHENMNDLAENKLYTKIDSGDFQAIKFRLSTKAKDRGYVERVEQRIEAKTETKIDFAELERIYKETSKY